MGMIVPFEETNVKRGAFKRSLSKGTVMMDISSPPKASRHNTEPENDADPDDDTLARELETLMEEASQFGPTFHAAGDSD